VCSSDLALLRPGAPPWARPLLTPAQLLRFDATSLREMTYLLGYGTIALERLGINGAAPYTATAAVRCRDGRVELVADPLAWASARARELRVTIANAEHAANYAVEVLALRGGRRPDGAHATRRAGAFLVEVSLAPRVGAPNTAAPEVLRLEVTRDGQIQTAASGAEPAAPR
jgi:hypothetical protein